MSGYIELERIVIAAERLVVALEKAVDRMPEPHEHEFKYARGTSYPCWCGMPPPDLCGIGIGQWVDDQRPTCQQFKHHEGPCA